MTDAASGQGPDKRPDGQGRWRRLVDTNLPSPDDIVEDQDAVPLRKPEFYVMAPRSAVILVSQ